MGSLLALKASGFFPEGVEGETEGVSDRSDGGKGRRGYATGLDLPQRLWRHACVQGDIEDGAFPSRKTQEGTEALSALDLFRSERQPDHDSNCNTGIE